MEEKGMDAFVLHDLFKTRTIKRDPKKKGDGL